MKKCTKCGLEKPSSYFSKDKSRKDGFYPQCKSCTNKYKRKLYKETKDIPEVKELSNQRSKEYYAKNKEKAKEYAKIYRLNNKEKIKNIEKNYKLSGKRKIANEKGSKKHRELYPEKVRARNTVNTAVYRGKIIKPNLCAKCNKNKKLEGHHNDYNKPLEVIWVCKECHDAIHYLDNN